MSSQPTPKTRSWSRFRLRTLLLLPVLFAAILTTCFMPTTTWIGPKAVTLDFVIRDDTTKQPIKGAEVQIIHPYDPETLPVKGLTGCDGHVKLMNNFTSYGKNSIVSFRPWVVRVDVQGCQPFQTSLGETEFVPSDGFADPPLGLSYLPPVIKVNLRRLTGCKEGNGLSLPD